MEFGIYTFADIETEEKNFALSQHQRIHDLMEEIQYADELGFDVFGVGEHHRADYAVSAPAIILAAASTITKKIKLSSAVNVLSSDDPVRIFQQFSTIDLLSNGRSEIMVGRGSFIESFPLFGYRLEEYEALFNEKLEMLLAINENAVLNWQGRLTQTVHNTMVQPRPFQSKLPIWIAVGGTPESVIRSARHGLPMALAIIGGMPKRFQPYTDLYRETYRKFLYDETRIQLSINAHFFIAEDGKKARDIYFPWYAKVMGRIGKERGWPPLSRQAFEAATRLEGALFVGSPDEVVEKLLYQYDLFKHTRFMAQISMSGLPHKEVLNAMELFAGKVIPEFRKHMNP